MFLQLGYAVSSCAWALARLGDADEAEEHLREGEQILEACSAHGVVLHHGWGFESLGRASLLLGRLEEAKRFGDQAIKYSASYSGYAAHASHLLGDVATHPDRFDAIGGEAQYRRALTLAEPHGMRPLVAHCHLGLGKIHRRAGKPQDAEHHHATATAMYRDMDMRFWLAQAQH